MADDLFGDMLSAREEKRSVHTRFPDSPEKEEETRAVSPEPGKDARSRRRGSGECPQGENSMFLLDHDGGEVSTHDSDGAILNGKFSLNGILSTACSSTPSCSSQSRPRRVQQCFNCGDEGHGVAQCPEPKNMARIRENSANFRQTQPQRPRDNGRYHAPSDRNNDDASGVSFRPGRLSANLLDALEISSNEIPEWIYRMRRKGFENGYPPGYLKLAIVGDGGGKRGDDGALLAFHVDEEKTTNCELDNSGEFASSPDDVCLDPDKMIYYYGFNVDRRNLFDLEGNSYRAPPFEDFVRYLETCVRTRYRERREKAESERKRDGKRHANGEALDEGENKRARQQPEDQVLDGESSIPAPPLPPSDDPLSSRDSTDCVVTLSSPSSPDPLGNPTLQRGSSITVTCGTPVDGRPLQTSSTPSNRKPSLEQFSAGIVPFSAEEDATPHRGFFQRMMKRLKHVVD